MDAGLAKVINSTVGTADFVPLDEALRRQYSIVHDDEAVLIRVYNDPSGGNADIPAGSSNAKTFLSFTANNSGSFKLMKTTLYTASNEVIIVSKNGNDEEVSFYGTDLIRLSNVFHFQKGDVVEFKLYKTYEVGRLVGLDIMAKSVFFPFDFQAGGD